MLVELLLSLLERDVVPVVPSRGSVGSSGDLAPLAHLALVLIGEGEAFSQGRRMPGGDALRGAGLQPVELAEKEGLALINGTHLMAACGGLALLEADVYWACRAGGGAVARGLHGLHGAVRRPHPRAASVSTASAGSPRACAIFCPGARS